MSCIRSAAWLLQRKEYGVNTAWFRNTRFKSCKLKLPCNCCMLWLSISLNFGTAKKVCVTCKPCLSKVVEEVLKEMLTAVLKKGWRKASCKLTMNNNNHDHHHHHRNNNAFQLMMSYVHAGQVLSHLQDSVSCKLTIRSCWSTCFHWAFHWTLALLRSCVSHANLA